MQGLPGGQRRDQRRAVGDRRRPRRGRGEVIDDGRPAGGDRVGERGGRRPGSTAPTSGGALVGRVDDLDRVGLRVLVVEQHQRELGLGDLPGAPGDQRERVGAPDLAEQHRGDLRGGGQPALAAVRQRVEPGVLDRDAGRGREGHRDLLVVVGELLGADLLGQIEVAEDLVAGADRHAEEAVHRRVVRREAVRPGVLGDVRHAQRARIFDQQAEHAAAVRQVTDLGVQLRVDAVRDELGEQLIGADHAERAVAGADHVAGGDDDPLQRAAQVQVRADADDGVEQCAEPFPAGHDFADPVEHLLEQLVEADPGQRGQAEGHRLPTRVGGGCFGPGRHVSHATPATDRGRVDHLGRRHPGGVWGAGVGRVGEPEPHRDVRPAHAGQDATQRLAGDGDLDGRAERHQRHAVLLRREPRRGQRLAGAQPRLRLVLVAVDDGVRGRPVMTRAYRQAPGRAEVATGDGGPRLVRRQHLGRQPGALGSGAARPVRELGADLRVLLLDRAGAAGRGGQVEHLVGCQDVQMGETGNRVCDRVESTRRHGFFADRPAVGVPHLHRLDETHRLAGDRLPLPWHQLREEIRPRRVGQSADCAVEPFRGQSQPGVVESRAAAQHEQASVRVGSRELAAAVGVQLEPVGQHPPPPRLGVVDRRRVACGRRGLRERDGQRAFVLGHRGAFRLDGRCALNADGRRRSGSGRGGRGPGSPTRESGRRTRRGRVIRPPSG